jgi:hypothetical protein
MILLRAVVCFLQFRLFRKVTFGEFKNDEILINLEANQLHRYVLCLANMLNQGDVQTKLTLPLLPQLLAKLHLGRNWRPYNTALLSNPCVQFRPRFIRGGWKKCSIDYFSESAKNEAHFRVPIGPHPLFWTWPHPVVPNRARGAFFAGDAGTAYDEFDELIWGMPSRNSAIHYLCNSGFQELITHRIPTEKYLGYLQEHNYFIALSGVSMPLCHSLYEAIYFQCIPLVHENVLRFLDPTLSEILRPFAWSSLEGLCVFLQNSNYILDNCLESTRSELRAYWDEHLNPVELAARIRNTDVVYLCAEEESVALMRRDATSKD